MTLANSLRRHPSLFIGLLIGLSPHARAQPIQIPKPSFPNHPDQPWMIDSYREPVFRAHLNNNLMASFDIECGVPKFDEPNITVTIKILEFTSETLNPKADFLASLAVNGETVTLPMKKFSESSGEIEFKFVAVSGAEFATVRKLADAISSGQRLSVSATGAPGTEVFEYSMPSGYSVGAVVRRCSPASIQAREEVADNRNIEALLVLEGSANGKCRGGLGDDPATQDACDERTEYDDRLEALGMCYGKPGEANYQMQWHRCGPSRRK